MLKSRTHRKTNSSPYCIGCRSLRNGCGTPDTDILQFESTRVSRLAYAPNTIPCLCICSCNFGWSLTFWSAKVIAFGSAQLNKMLTTLPFAHAIVRFRPSVGDSPFRNSPLGDNVYEIIVGVPGAPEPIASIA